MKKQKYMKIAAILLLVISQIFYWVDGFDSEPLYFLSRLIFTLSSVCLIIGIIKKNKIVTALYCVYPVFFLGRMIIGSFSWYLVSDAFSELALAVALVLLIFNLFDSPKTNTSLQVPTANPKEQTFNANLLLEYKNLLDSGTITAEEFEIKKKEMLDL